MTIATPSATKVCAAAAVVIIPLIAAAWLPPWLPPLLRQLALFVWGVGMIVVAERMLFSDTLAQALRSVGFVRAPGLTAVVAVFASLPMWFFLPLLARTNGIGVDVRPEWAMGLVGVVLVNGITEEVIHRGFVFGHLRGARSFAAAATISAIVFAAQHLYIILSTGLIPGVASVVLAALLAFPLAFAYERGGHSIVGPAILHTSSNAPVMLFALPTDFMTSALVPHMGVTLGSMYLVFVLQPVFERFAYHARKAVKAL